MVIDGDMPAGSEHLFGFVFPVGDDFGGRIDFGKQLENFAPDDVFMETFESGNVDAVGCQDRSVRGHDNGESCVVATFQRVAFKLAVGGGQERAQHR
jgi:hypothetical protein